MARKRAKVTYTYKCSITEKKFVRTKKITNTEDLISVKAYYELNPDKDDRPERVLKEIDKKEQEEKQSLEDFFGDEKAEE